LKPERCRLGSAKRALRTLGPGAIVGLRSKKAATDGKEAASASPKRCCGTKDFGSLARKEMDLRKLFDMAKRACVVPALRCSQPFDKNAGAVRRPRHFDSNNSNFKYRPSAGYTSADLLRQYRNLLHPAYCFKQDIHPTKDTGIRATKWASITGAAKVIGGMGAAAPEICRYSRCLSRRVEGGTQEMNRRHSSRTYGRVGWPRCRAAFYRMDHFPTTSAKNWSNSSLRLLKIGI